MTDTFKIYGNLKVSGGSTSDYISASTFTTNSGFFGKISSVYIGSGNTPNWVSDQEFSYLSASTSNLQLQINEKPSNIEPYITFSGDGKLSNSKIISAGTNVLFYSSSTHFATSAQFKQLNLNVVVDTPTLNSNYTVNNYSPLLFSGNFPNRAANIIMVPSQPFIQITGLSADTYLKSRYVTITNKGNGIIYFSALSTGSTSINRFNITDGTTLGYFLGPNKSISFIHNGTNWIQLSNSNVKYGLQNFSILEDMTDYASTVASGANRLYNNDFLSYSGVGPTASSTNGGALLVGENAFRMNLYNPDTLGSPLHRQMIGSFGNKIGYQFSGESNLMVTCPSIGASALTASFVLTSGFIGDTTLSTTYSARTNNNINNFPNYSGGSFWISDFSGSSFLRYAVQTSDGSSIVSTTNIPPSNISLLLGVYTINGSQSSFGTSCFFYRPFVTTTTGITSSDLIIYNPIIHTGNTAQSVPMLRFESGYQMFSPSNGPRVTTLNLFGTSKFNLI